MLLVALVGVMEPLERFPRTLPSNSAQQVCGASIPDLSEIDVCVSNAAITDTIAAADRIDLDAWDRDIEVNLTRAFRAVQACLSGMRERHWGRIVVISSGAARDGLPGQVAYTASKAGLVGMVTLTALVAERCV